MPWLNLVDSKSFIASANLKCCQRVSIPAFGAVWASSLLNIYFGDSNAIQLTLTENTVAHAFELVEFSQITYNVILSQLIQPINQFLSG